MYLKNLMQGEKYAFYSIAKKLVSIDGDYSEEEKNLIDSLLVEMELIRANITDIDFDDAVDMFTFSSMAIRKQVFIEIIGISLCDETFDESEKELVNQIAERFGISAEDRDAMIKMVDELLNLYKDMQAMIEKQ